MILNIPQYEFCNVIISKIGTLLLLYQLSSVKPWPSGCDHSLSVSHHPSLLRLP